MLLDLFKYLYTVAQSHEVKFLKKTEYQINRCERTKEYLMQITNYIQEYSNIDIQELKLTLHF